jgi:pyridoxine 5'-phosphate synthase PdxJ
MSSPESPSLVMQLCVAMKEQCEQLKAERDLYRSLLQKAEENAASEKKRLEAQIVELHRQNYALVDVNERLANLLQDEELDEIIS